VRAAAEKAKPPKEAPCAVCVVREGSGPEPVAATFVYQGKTYFFCKQACKEEFRLDPEKWVKAAAAAPATPAKPGAPKAGATAVPT
jgi:YHS domain-containing protein